VPLDPEPLVPLDPEPLVPLDPEPLVPLEPEPLLELVVPVVQSSTHSPFVPEAFVAQHV
jgi:hypothetical protein